MKRLLVFAVLTSVGAWAASLPEKELDLTWGGRKEHPAVVNPVLGNEPGSVLSLRGEWEFTVDYCRDLGCVFGHCNTRCQIERRIQDEKGVITTWDYNIYTWDQYRDGRVFNGMATWIWNRM